MGSICIECEGNEFVFDDRLGERICVSCGFVQVIHIFEDTNRTIVSTDHRHHHHHHHRKRATTTTTREDFVYHHHHHHHHQNNNNKNRRRYRKRISFTVREGK